MLALHDDAHGDGRNALVHDSPQGGNEGWNISWVNSKEKSLGCYLMKAQDRHRYSSLVSSMQRDETTFWVHVSEYKKTTWRILVQQPERRGMFHSYYKL